MEVEGRIRLPEKSDLAEFLTQQSALHTATGWTLAAAVAAAVGPAPGRGPGSKEEKSSFTITDIEKFKIRGLKTNKTIERYRDAWFDAGLPQPKLGCEVELPDLVWPPAKAEPEVVEEQKSKAEPEKEDAGRWTQLASELPLEEPKTRSDVTWRDAIMTNAELEAAAMAAIAKEGKVTIDEMKGDYWDAHINRIVETAKERARISHQDPMDEIQAATDVPWYKTRGPVTDNPDDLDAINRREYIIKLGEMAKRTRVSLEMLLQQVRSLTLSELEQASLRGHFRGIKNSTDLVMLSFTGTSGTDWDAEMAKMGDDDAQK